MIPWFIWLALISVSSAVLGAQWDIAWHRSIGRDTFWSPPHIADQLRCAAGPQITSGGDRRGKAGPTASPNEREPRRTEQSASRAGQAAGSREG